MRLKVTLPALVVTSLALGAAQAQAPQLIRDGVGRTDPQIADELPRYLAVPAARFVAWLGDGSVLIARGHPAEVERLGAPLAAATRVSSAARGIIEVSARPYTSDAFVYVSPSGKDEGDGAIAAGATAGAVADAEQPAEAEVGLFLQSIGAARRRLALTRADAGAPAWAHDGQRLAFAGDQGDIYVLDTTNAEAAVRLVVPAEGAHWRVLGWSIDDQTLLLGRELPSAAELALYLADLGNGALHPVPPVGARRSRRTPPFSSGAEADTATVQASTARFAADGRAILLLTPQGCERRAGAAPQPFLHLCYTDPAAGEWRQLSAPTPHDVELFDASADGSWIAYTLNDEGTSRLMLLDQHRQLASEVNALEPGVISTLNFDPTAKRLAVTFESPRIAPSIYVLDVSTRELVRWTHSDETLLAADELVQPQRVHFPTWDAVEGAARQLPALLYRPSVAADGSTGTRPVVVWLCSGGGEQCRPLYAPFVQYLVQKLGFIVIAPNVRGSSGSGSELAASSSGPLRDDAVRDIGSLLVWIGLQPGLDRSHVALMGEGFGSYLALASLGEFGDRLSGAVAAFPQGLSALPNALAIRRPVLLVHGLADPNVPPYQVAQLREGLRAHGVPVQYLAAGDEGARFAQQSNREAYHEAVATFLERLLR